MTSDLKKLQISLSFEEISSLSKQQFKQIVNSSCLNASFNFLLNEKSKLSKGINLKYSKMSIQSYFLPGNNISIDCMRKIFEIRSRNMKLKCNFPNQYNDRKCLVPQCLDSDSQLHLYTCKYLSEKSDRVMLCDLSYEDIFKDDVAK